jgi:hypothetical protein
VTLEEWGRNHNRKSGNEGIKMAWACNANKKLDGRKKIYIYIARESEEGTNMETVEWRAGTRKCARQAEMAFGDGKTVNCCNNMDYCYHSKTCVPPLG